VMPVLDGVQAMRALHDRGSRSQVIVLTSFLDDERILPAIRAGAAGYLLKDVEPAELAAAVRGATSERAAIDPTVAARLLQSLSDPTTQDGAPDLDALTRREREVLCLIAAGRSNKRIAFELEIAEKTVKTHVGHVLAKLGVSDRTQAALVAVRAGLTDGS
jgi:two-component system, NarL family, response regulator LiaR